MTINCPQVLSAHLERARSTDWINPTDQQRVNTHSHRPVYTTAAAKISVCAETNAGHTVPTVTETWGVWAEEGGTLKLQVDHLSSGQWFKIIIYYWRNSNNGTIVCYGFYNYMNMETENSALPELTANHLHWENTLQQRRQNKNQTSGAEGEELVPGHLLLKCCGFKVSDVK